jgi:hypothetical protein
MDSDEEIEQFYKNWLAINQTNNQPNPQQSSPSQNDDSIDNLSQIVYENDIFQLYIEKGNFI